MGKIELPETVKVAIVGSVGAGSVGQVKLPLALGKKEVAIILSVRVVSDQNVATDPYVQLWALWRKSDAEWPEANIRALNCAENSDIIACGNIINHYTLTVEGGGISRAPAVDDFVFPYPIVVVRPPQLLHQQQENAGKAWGALIYYLTQEVTDETLAKLMVKDHA